MNILGIESSCDETAAAVMGNGRKILSSVVASQVEVHHPYGGVVPELASRKHMEGIVPVVDEALKKSGIEKDQIEAVAVTQGPGLVGALLVGFCFAKAWAYGRGIPMAGVNHLHGHINSVFLGPEQPQFPFIALLVSGGHTGIYDVTSHTEIMLMGQTRDDAAGEAFDKVAKMLGMGYPGGRVIEDLARQGDPQKIRFKRPYLDKSEFDFSFSGIKSAVGRHIHSRANQLDAEMPDIAAGFQEAVIDVLSYKLFRAAKKKNRRDIALVGGVAANGRLRERIREESKRHGRRVFIPSLDLCGDNAAMIAMAGYHMLKAGKTTALDADAYSRVVETRSAPI